MILGPIVVMPHRNRLGSVSSPANSSNTSNSNAGPSKKQKATAYVLKTFDQSGANAFASDRIGERGSNAAEGSSHTQRRRSTNRFVAERDESGGSNGSISASSPDHMDFSGPAATTASFERPTTEQMTDTPGARPGSGLVGHRRASSQSLTLDLDGLDLGMHGGAATMGRPIKAAGYEQTASSHRSHAGLGRVLPSSAYIPSSSLSKEISPIAARATTTDAVQRPAVPTSRIPSEAAQQQHHMPAGTEEDSFAAHLRECEDAHDIPTVETVLQQRSEEISLANLAAASSHDKHGDATPPTTTAIVGRAMPSSTVSKASGEGTGQVLGAFASLGLMGQHRPITSILGVVGSDAEMTASTSSFGLSSSPISPIQGVEVLSPWCTLSPHECDPMGIVDILSIDEMGLHSINIGSADDWRGTSLSGAYQEQRPTTAPYDDSLAEWLVARNVKRQRKWIVTPANLVAARTVVVSDHIATSGPAATMDATAGGTIHPSAFSGHASFSFRFLQAGNRAPDCTIVLSTPSAHRALAEKRRQLSPAATSTLNSMSLHDEQMRSLGALTTTMLFEDAWPAMRTRANTSAAYPTDCASERRLTHSKSISTIIASSVGHHNESRRPSLGKSMSHDGLAPDASPRTQTESSFNPMTSSSSDVKRKSVGSSLADQLSSDSPNLTSSTRPPPEERMDTTITTDLPSESSSPFGQYAFQSPPTSAPKVPIALGNTATSPLTPTRARAPFDSDMSPRSPARELHSPLFDVGKSFPGQSVLSSLDHTRLSALQGRAGPSPSNFTASGSSSRRMANSPATMIPPSMATAAAMTVAPSSASYGGTSGTGRSSGRRDKRLSEWLRRKVLPGNGGTGHASGASNSGSSMWPPPLPPAWEPSFPPTSAANHVSLAGAMTAASDEHVLRRTESAQSSSSSAVAASEANSAATAPTLPLGQGELDIDGMGIRMPTGLLEQRRRSNSDDFIAAMATAERHRVQAAAAAAAAAATAATSTFLATDSAAATRKGRSASGNANLISSISSTLGDQPPNAALGVPATMGMDQGNASLADAGRRRGVSMLAMPTTSPYVQHNKLPNTNAAVIDTMSPSVFSPELLGLDDVPSEAMTMVIALPLSDQSDLSVAARYLRVSFVPFPASSHADDTPVAAEHGTAGLGSMSHHAAGGGGHASHNWYRRLAHAWHPTASSVSNSGHSVCSDEDCLGLASDRSPPNGMVAAAAAGDSSSDATAAGLPPRLLEPFRIIAKVFDSPQRITGGTAPKVFGTGGDGVFGTDTPAAAAAAALAASVDAAGASTSSTALLPQPFSFPVILGVCDMTGRLDLIPEGWQSIGLSSGPAPVYPSSKLMAMRAASASNGISAMPPPHHPLRGVADLIIAGCAACMNL